MCISTEESFYILKYNADAADRAKENPELITEDGIEEAFDVIIFFIENITIHLKRSQMSICPHAHYNYFFIHGSVGVYRFDLPPLYTILA